MTTDMDTVGDKQTQGIGKGTPGPGRPKGSLNKATRTAKDAIALAAEGLGGGDGLLAWVRRDERNESAFWTTIYPKLLPLTVGGDPDSPLGLTHQLSATTLELLRQVSPSGADSSIPPPVQD